MKNLISRRVFRALLLLYPREFRTSYGPRMEEAFQASLQRRASDRSGILYTWARVVWDTVVHAVDLRFRGRGTLGAPRGRPKDSPPRNLRGGSGLGVFLSNLGQDLRFTLRTLKKSSTFAVIVVAIAGLGISLTTLAFTTVNASFLRPLPHVRDPGELVKISRVLPSAPGRPHRLSYQDYLHLRERSTNLKDLVGALPYRELLLRTGSDLDRQVIGGEVTEAYFQALGIPMVLGRGILPEDEGSGVDVAVLGHATWMREFGGSREALGQVVRVDGRQHTIVGVAPKGLGFLSGEPVEAAIWIPVRPRYRETYDWNGFLVAGRPKGGVTLPQVQAELDGLVSGLVESEPDRWIEDAGTVALRVRTDRQARLDLIGGPRGLASIIIYMVFIGLIMLITCSNVATLLLNRALKRRAEIAMRLALGAGRSRLVGQLLTESVLLFAIAGALSLLLLSWGTEVLADGWGASLPAVADITLDFKVAVAAFGVTLLSGVVFGLAPALQATRPKISPALRGIGEGGRSRRFSPRNLLVLAQVTASMVLVAVSGLIVRDIQQAEAIDIGFDPGGVVVSSLDLSHGEYTQEEGRRWLEALGERLEGLPGVGGVALSAWVPLSGSRWTQWIHPEGVELAPSQPLYAVYNAVSPGYFDMIGMPLVAGRDFEDTDSPDAPAVIIVNQAFARLYWPNQEALGKTVVLSESQPGAKVVGIVQDAMYGMTDLRNGGAEPHLWTSRGQVYHSATAVHVRAVGASAPVLAAIRSEIRLMDEDLPIRELTTMQSLTDEALFESRASAILFGGFSILALVLAALGIYGVMAHAVQERTREMGVRMAVGAAPGRVVGMVLVDSIRLSAAGILMGIPLAMLVGLGIRTLLVGVSLLDPLSVSGSVAVLVSAALAAGLAPAIRAATTDPLLSLKSE